MDTSKIQGYSSMTLEEKLQALETYDDEPSKRAVTNANAEAAKYKQQYKQALAEKENATNESQKELQALKEQVAQLQREKTLNEFYTQYRDLGYNEELAKSTATALVDNDHATLFANGKKARALWEQNAQAQMTKGTPRPEHSATSKSYTKAEIMAIKDDVERQKAIQDNINLFT